MFNWIMQTGSWNLNHWNFKILFQIRHWNHTKTVRQLIVIKFSKSCFTIFSMPELHNDCIWFIIFFLFWILIHCFFHFFYNTSKYLNPERQKFSPTELIFISNFSQHKHWKIEETYSGIKKTELKLQRHNGIDV